MRENEGIPDPVDVSVLTCALPACYLRRGSYVHSLWAGTRRSSAGRSSLRAPNVAALDPLYPISRTASLHFWENDDHLAT